MSAGSQGGQAASTLSPPLTLSPRSSPKRARMPTRPCFGWARHGPDISERQESLSKFGALYVTSDIALVGVASLM